MSPMNNRRMTPMAEPGILDFAPGAAAAYSLRNLSYTYTGPVVTVRRSTDNAVADFTAAEVSDGTLAGWAGADGFVKQWWDQSGNARHATQATTTAQPQIVDSGVLVTEGGKAAVRFDGVDDKAEFSLPAMSAVTVAAVCANNKDNTTEDRQDALRGPSGFLFASFVFDNQYRFRTSATAIEYGAVDLDQKVHFAINDGTTSSARINGGVTYSGTDAAPSSGVYELGGDADSNYGWSGTISELLIYPTDMTALRTRIEGNLAWYY